MPRLTNPTYLRTYFWLSGQIAQDRMTLSCLSPTEQSYLHAYFRPTEAISAPDLLAHRKSITRQRPSLPQSAGRALRKLQDHQTALVELPASSPAPATKSSHRRIVVHSVIRPEPDIERMAKALLRAAEDLKRKAK